MRHLCPAICAAALAAAPFAIFAAGGSQEGGGPQGGTFMNDEMVKRVVDEAGKGLGAQDLSRLERGVRAIAPLWRPSDGSEQEFGAFVKKQFLPSGGLLDRTFERFETNFESLYGSLLVASRDLSRAIQLDWGEPLPIDHLFAEYNVYAHLLDDFFGNKIAFIALLNFPPFTLKEKLALGPSWDRAAWARARVAEAFRDRVPAEVNQKVAEVFTRVDTYISEYNIHMGRVVDGTGAPLFPEDLKLITHWGLRDELKAQYARADGAPRQEAIYRIMTRIIDGTVPVEVINRREFLWDPDKNVLFDAQKKPVASQGGEGAGRYERLRQIFGAERLLDPYVPGMPTHIARRFERERQIPEDEVERLLVAVLESPQVKETAALIAKRLKRGLKPYDIWYTGFRAGQSLNEDDLDRTVRKKYPTVEKFQKDIPNILKKVGFDEKTARFLADHIEVDPARGAGHAMGADRRTDKAHLRTRVPREGMNYKGFNIAVHELGHCVEQVLTLNKMDFYSLRSVPNTAFTESYAFMFQSRDLEILGAAKPDPRKASLEVLNKFWMTYEIAGVSMVDMRVWRWMYAHPGATADDLRDAVLAIAREVWNRYYAPVFGVADVTTLAVYSHMIDAALYLPDYPIGHLINFQIEEHVKRKNLASEMQRMVASGSVTPAQWMKNATGGPLSAEPLLRAAEKALKDTKD